MRTQLVDGLFADLLQVVRFLRVYKSPLFSFNFFAGYGDAFSLLVSVNNGAADRLLFPNYLDWFILTSRPENANIKEDFVLTNTLDHPFQIGLTFAVDPMNTTLLDESFTRCMRKDLPVLAKKVERIH